MQRGPPAQPHIHVHAAWSLLRLDDGYSSTAYQKTRTPPERCVPFNAPPHNRKNGNHPSPMVLNRAGLCLQDLVVPPRLMNHGAAVPIVQPAGPWAGADDHLFENVQCMKKSAVENSGRRLLGGSNDSGDDEQTDCSTDLKAVEADFVKAIEASLSDLCMLRHDLYVHIRDDKVSWPKKCVIESGCVSCGTY